MVSETACRCFADARGAHRTPAGLFLSDQDDLPIVATSDPLVA
jgi:hypothetical protein